MAPDHIDEQDEDSSQTTASEREDFVDDASDADQETVNEPPVHPIVAMQGAFEESIVESMEQAGPHQAVLPGAKARRQRLLEQDDYNGSYNARWRKKPTAKYHPLHKLVAQISFGIHLLQQHLAKSDEEVVKILQRHVDEVDTFLENTTEDFDLALKDIKERINYLRLPLEHVNIFDIMLDDKQFRTSIIDGNEKIERIVDRTAQAMNDSLVDVSNGNEVTRQLEDYLESIGSAWAKHDEELMTICKAMEMNVGAWLRCYHDLEMKGNSLGVALVQLGSILNEMSKRAGIASRRSLLSSRAEEKASGSSSRISSPPPTSRFARSQSNKPLPEDPDLVEDAVQATLPLPQRRGSNRSNRRTTLPPLAERKMMQWPEDDEPQIKDTRYERPRQAPQSPPLQRTGRPRSRIEPRPSDPKRDSTADLATFFRESAPPTPERRPSPKGGKEAKRRTSNKLVRRASSKTKKTERRKSREVLKEVMLGPREKGRHDSPMAPDSAYASGESSSEKRMEPSRPATSHSRPPSRLSLFPSNHSTRTLHSNGSSLTLKTPRRAQTDLATCPNPIVPPGRSATTRALKKKSSFGILRRMFSLRRSAHARSKSAGASPMTPGGLYDIEEKV